MAESVPNPNNWFVLQVNVITYLSRDKYSLAHTVSLSMIIVQPSSVAHRMVSEIGTINGKLNYLGIWVRLEWTNRFGVSDISMSHIGSTFTIPI